MAKSYSKGYRAEYEMLHTLSGLGYMVMRAPHSGSINLASPDIIAVKNGKVFVIECKSRASAFKIQIEQLNELKEWREKAGAHAIIGCKIARKGWKFLQLDDVYANNGNIGKKFIAEKGIGMEIFK